MNRARRYMALSAWLISASIFAIVPSRAEDSSIRTQISVQENLRQMDKDNDGMVSVHEVRAALEARHGKGYEQSLLADMEASASGRSCSTPFAQNFY